MRLLLWIWCKLAHAEDLTIDSIRWAGSAASIRECQACGRRWATTSVGLSYQAFLKWEAGQVAAEREDSKGEADGR